MPQATCAFSGRHVAAPSTSRKSHITHANPPPPAGNNKPKKNSLPERGFFADVDPTAEVYPVRRGLGGGDVTKRGGRWQSDFIWNTNWQEQLEYEEDVRRQNEEGKAEAAAGTTNAGKGFLSLTSKVDLNSMDVDLSQQLKPRPKPSTPSTSKQQQNKPNLKAGYPAIPATRGEVRGWDRSGKFSTKVIPVAPTFTPEDEEALAATVAAELAEYNKMKQELQSWAAGLTAVCLAATYAFYGRDIAASYGVGAVGGLLYLRLLNRSVDGLGGLGGAASQPRLLIPVILALGYNRYNTMAAESVGLQLQLLPMLVGFFTYKGAVIARQGLVLFGDIAGGYERERTSGMGDAVLNQQEGDNSDNDGGAASVERAFKKS